jgi:hypothetical protein
MSSFKDDMDNRFPEDENEELIRLLNAVGKIKQDSFTYGRSKGQRKKLYMGLTTKDKDNNTKNLINRFIRNLLRKRNMRAAKEFLSHYRGITELRPGVATAEDQQVLENNDIHVDLNGKQQQKLTGEIDKSYEAVTEDAEKLLTGEIDKSYEAVTEDAEKLLMSKQELNNKDLLRALLQIHKAQKPAAVEPIGPKKPPRSLSKMFTDIGNDSLIQSYMDVVQKIFDVAILPLYQSKSSTDTVKELFTSWASSIIQSVKTIILQMLAISKKMNMAFLATASLNFESGFQQVWELVSDSVMLLAAAGWIWLNLEALHCLLVLTSILTGLDYTAYMRVVINEFTTLCYSLVVDAVLLPLRTAHHIFKGESEHETYSEAATRNGRLWYVVKYVLEIILRHVNTFFNVVKASDPAVGSALTGLGKAANVLQWLYGQLAFLADQGVKLAAFVGEQAEEIARHVAQTVINNLKNVPQLLTAGVGMVTKKFEIIKGIAGSFLPKQITGVYDAMAICSILGISVNQLQRMKNQNVVSFVMNNRNMSDIHVLLAVCELNKELMEDKLKLKF